ncbi:hypothetical protein [Pedobacter sp. JCM 36344]|uniref:hypothetical protein n=1 Tax=Pedobacter sp. JCM 36344 TaxID=3374280 RepID=UPI0039789660
MKTFFKTAALAIFAAFALLTSCSNTKLLSSYAAPNSKLPKSSKVLVMAMMGDQDKKLRANMEKIMVESLQDRGINAGSAIEEFGIDALKSLDEKTAMKKIKDQGFDGAFTIALLDKTKESSYKRGGIGIAPYPYRFWGYYNHYYSNFYGRIYTPGYISDDNRFILEGSVYGLQADKLLYSAKTKTFNPSSPKALASEFTKKLLNDMYKNGVIAD